MRCTMLPATSCCRYVMLLVIGSHVACSQTVTKRLLDNLSKIVGDREFDPNSWQRIRQCMQRYSGQDLDLLQASDAAWEGFVDLGVSGSVDLLAGKDLFDEFNPMLVSLQSSDQFYGADELIIVEPCNTVSNTAYYHAMISFCDMEAAFDWPVDPNWTQGFVRASHGLAFGSFLAHAYGMANPGRVLDGQAISVFAYILHQVAIQELSYDPIIHDLSLTPRQGSSLELAKDFNEALIRYNVDQWETVYRSLDVPDYEQSFASIMLTYINVIFDADTATRMVDHMIQLFEPKDEISIRRYERHIRHVLKGVNPSFPTRVDLFWKLVGVSVKMIYAFVWQEQRLASSLDSNPTALRLGSRFMPLVNRFANRLTDYGRGRDWDDPRIQTTDGPVYPGDTRCRREQAHSKWHEQSANALVDMALLGLSVDQVLKGHDDNDQSRLRPHLAAVVLAPTCAVKLAVQSMSPMKGAFSWLGRNVSFLSWMAPVSSSAEDQMRDFTDCLLSSSPLFRCSKKCSMQRETLLQCLGDCLMFIGD